MDRIPSVFAYLPKLEGCGYPKQTYNPVPFLASVADVITCALTTKSTGEYSRQKKVKEWTKITTQQP
jgi:hypothetical protein